MAAKLSSLLTGRALLPQRFFLFLGVISFRDYVNSNAHCGQNDKLNCKMPLTLLGLERATFFLACISASTINATAWPRLIPAWVSVLYSPRPD
jgi:hypothetical protein